MNKANPKLLFLISLLLLFCMSWSIAVSAFPKEQERRHYAKDYKEYERLLEEEKIPFRFVKYDAIKDLGEFRAFHSDLDFDKYEYELVAKGTNGESTWINVYIKHMDRHAEPPAFSDAVYKECSLSRVLDFPHMALLDVSDMDPVIPGRNEDWWSPVEESRGPYPYWYYYVRADNMTYVYDHIGNLGLIRFCSNGLDVSIAGSFENLPDGVADTDTLMGMALDYNQGRAAARHLAFKMTKQRWALIVIIGVIVLVVSAFAICFVMRKKFKNSHRLGTNGGNPALADGVPTDNSPADDPAAGENASSASGVSAPPTPAEGMEADAALPEEDTKTDPPADRDM